MKTNRVHEGGGVKNDILFSLRHKMLGLFVLTLIVPLLSAGLLIYERYSQDLLMREMKASAQLVRETSRNIDDYLWRIEQLSFDISSNAYIQDILLDFNPNRFIGPRVETAVFQNLFGANRLYSQHVFYIKIANMDGESTLSVGNMPRRDRELDDVFLDTNQERSMWIDRQNVEVFGFNRKSFQLVSHYRWIPDAHTGIPLGYVRIDIEAGTLNRLLSAYQHKADASLYIANGDGLIIGADHAQNIGRRLSDLYGYRLPADSRLPAGRNHALSPDGNHYILSNPLSTNDWHIVHVIPADSVGKLVASVRQYMVVIALICLVFSLLLSTVVSYYITRPLGKLIHVIRKVRNGNIDVTFEVNTRDELALVATSFNQMLSSIRDLLRKNEEIRRQEIIAEAMYLQSQINPHFLYNTLDSIRWTARRNRDLEVSRQIEMLSNLFRYYLHTDKEFVTFRQEIRQIENYMSIQQFRFRDTLSFSIRFDEELMELYTIKLILQPLVENAIVHGFEGITENGFISITGRIVDDAVLISVEDNGMGFDAAGLMQRLERGEEETASFALLNIHKRIRLHFGERYGIRLHSVPGRGTVATLTLPVLTKMPTQGAWQHETDDRR